MPASHPLADLLNNKGNSVTMLQYPSDLGSAKKGHWINFYISTPEKSTVSKLKVENPVTATSSSPLLNSANTVAALQAPETSLGSEDFMYKYTVTPGTVKLDSTVSLYMPDTFNIGQHSNYTSTDLTKLFGAAGMLGTASGAFYDMFKGNDVAAKEALKNLGLESVANATNGEQLAGFALKSQGNAVNPQMELLFDRIDFRTFQFDFLFTPKSAAEAAVVKDIIKTFKYHAAPDIDYNSTGRYFIVPSVFEIEVFFQNGPNSWVNKFAVSALETIVVDYSPQGWVTHQDGSPVQTRMTLQFKEMDIMTKTKINQGY